MTYLIESHSSTFGTICKLDHIIFLVFLKCIKQTPVIFLLSDILASWWTLCTVIDFRILAVGWQETITLNARNSPWPLFLIRSVLTFIIGSLIRRFLSRTFQLVCRNGLRNLGTWLVLGGALSLITWIVRESGGLFYILMGFDEFLGRKLVL